MLIQGDKRGVELSMNVIIIAILAILVLVVVVVFFAGGFGNLTQKIKGIFGSQTIDTSTAVLNCQNYCSKYELTEKSSYKLNFCNKEFDIDEDGDGKADSKLDCRGLGVSCSSIEC